MMCIDMSALLKEFLDTSFMVCALCVLPVVVSMLMVALLVANARSPDREKHGKTKVVAAG